MKSLGINDQVLVIGCISKIIRLTDQAKQNKYKGYHLDISSIQMKKNDHIVTSKICGKKS